MTGSSEGSNRAGALPRYPERACLRQWWQAQRWPIIGALWLLALTLGYAGFARYYAALGEPRTPLDLAYLTVQLFTMNSGAVEGVVNWQLQVARWLAPAVAAYTAFAALAVLFYEQLQMVRVRRLRDHVVICGLGRKGLLLAEGFRARGDAVVVIERDEGNENIDLCRETGAVVLIGNAASPEMLAQTRVGAARHVIAVSGDDGANTEVAVRAQELVAGQPGAGLTCTVHIVDPQLCDLLRERELEAGAADGFRLEFFNVFGSGARALLSEHPAFGRAGEGRPHPLVVGLGRLGETLAVQAAREWWGTGAAPEERLRLTVIDRDAEAKTRSLALRYPQLRESCELVPLTMDIRGPEYQEAGFLVDGEGRCEVSIVYVCLDDDSLGLSAALALRQKVREQGIPVVVRMAHEGGLARLLGGEGGFENLHAFGLLDRTCTPEIVLGGTHERIARAIHEDYLRREGAKGQTADENEALVPWEALSEELKESNRRQADQMGQKLKSIGCGIAPLTDWQAAGFCFGDEQVEAMARMEHKRWMAERLREGYRLGPRDPEERTNPNLLPWEQLSAESRELTREMVRRIPVLLARVDLQVCRLVRPE